MERAKWKGTIRFGLVSVPVRVCTAVRDKSVHFHQTHKGEPGSRVQYAKVCTKCFKSLPDDQIGKSWEVNRGLVIDVDPAELDKLAPKGDAHAIDLRAFVPMATIDPTYFDGTDWCLPDKGASLPYRLLLATMERSGRAAVGTVLYRDKLRLVVLWPRATDTGAIALALSELHRADEMVQPEPDSMETIGTVDEVGERELTMARMLVDELSVSAFNPAAYPDEHRERVLAYLNAKAQGIAPAPVVLPDAAPAGVGSLADALEASLRSVKDKAKVPKVEGKPESPPAKRGGRKTAAR